MGKKATDKFIGYAVLLGIIILVLQYIGWIGALVALGIAAIWFFNKVFGGETVANKSEIEKRSLPPALELPKQDDSLSPSWVIKNFKTKIRGVTYKNPDGTDRQKIIAKCKKGEEIKLVREPDNPHNIANIAVFRKSGEQIGNISKDVAFRHPAFKDLTYHMDIGAEVSAKVIQITGGKNKNYGCVIEISIGEIPCAEKEIEAKNLLMRPNILKIPSH